MEANAPPVAVFLRRWNDRLKLEISQLADATQGIDDALLLGFQLCVVAQVLPRATAASADIGARWRLAKQRRSEHAGRFADRVALFLFGDPHLHRVTGRRVGNHYRLAVQPADAVGTVGKSIDL